MTKRKNDCEETHNRKRRKILPDSAIRRVIENLTPFRSKESINIGHEGAKRKLFTEKRSFGYCIAITLPFLALGIYTALTLLKNVANFDLFVATGIFATVALLCFCSMKLLMCNNKEKNDNEEEIAAPCSTIEFSKTYAIQGMVKL